MDISFLHNNFIVIIIAQNWVIAGLHYTLRHKGLEFQPFLDNTFWSQNRPSDE